MTKQLARIALVASLGLSTLSCQPLEKSSGDLQVAMTSEAFLLDVTASSCKSFLLTEDIAALHMNLGRFKLDWAPPSAAATLRIAYIRIKLTSSGLAGQDIYQTIGSEELNCIMRGSLSGDPTLQSTEPSFTFLRDLKIGGLRPADATKANSFRGTGDVLVYGIISGDGADRQYYGSTSFKFSFEGFR